MNLKISPSKLKTTKGQTRKCTYCGLVGLLASLDCWEDTATSEGVGGGGRGSSLTTTSSSVMGGGGGGGRSGVEDLDVGLVGVVRWWLGEE